MAAAHRASMKLLEQMDVLIGIVAAVEAFSG